MTTFPVLLRLSWRTAASILLLGGCGETRDGASGGAPPQHPKCGPTPIRLVNFIDDLPDAERSQVSTPEIAVNATDLFYLVDSFVHSEGTGYLMRAPLRGGHSVRLAVIPEGLGGSHLQPIAVTPTGVLYGQGPGGDAGPGTVVSMPARGGEPKIVATTSGRASSLVADDQNLYFVDREATKSVPLGGGQVRTLAKPVAGLAVAGGTLFLANAFVANGDASVASLPTEGGPVKILASGQWQAVAPTPCGGDFCWLTIGLDASLLRVGLDGGTPVVIAGGLPEPNHLAFDGRNFFITQAFPEFAVWRIAEDGTQRVVAEAPGASGLALDDECLYWSSQDGIFSISRSVADEAAKPVYPVGPDR